VGCCASEEPQEQVGGRESDGGRCRRRRAARVNSLEESVRAGEEGMQVSQKREVR
jgi:hypothetical protein